MSPKGDTGSDPLKKLKWQNLKQLLLFLAFAATSVYAVYINPWPPVGWNWVLPIGASIFCIMAIISFFQLLGEWSQEKAAAVTGKVFAWIIGAPIAAGVACYGLYLGWGWISSIPSWAAVIIALLVAILVKMKA